MLRRCTLCATALLLPLQASTLQRRVDENNEVLDATKAQLLEYRTNVSAVSALHWALGSCTRLGACGSGWGRRPRGHGPQAQSQKLQLYCRNEGVAQECRAALRSIV